MSSKNALQYLRATKSKALLKSMGQLSPFGSEAQVPAASDECSKIHLSRIKPF